MKELKKNLSEVRFPNFKLLITGDGRVNRGVQEVLEFTNIKKIISKRIFRKNYQKPVYCNLDTKDYVIHKTKKQFELKHFIEFPKEYEATTFEY